MTKSQKIAVVGAGPVGSLAALYAAQRGYEVEVYELRPGEFLIIFPTMILGLHIFLATQLRCAATDLTNRAPFSGILLSGFRDRNQSFN